MRRFERKVKINYDYVFDASKTRFLVFISRHQNIARLGISLIPVSSFINNNFAPISHSVVNLFRFTSIVTERALLDDEIYILKTFHYSQLPRDTKHVSKTDELNF